MHLRCIDSVREIMKFLKRKYLDRAGVLRDVEKLHFLQNSKNLGDRKSLGKLRKSFVGHPDTILFSRICLRRTGHPFALSGPAKGLHRSFSLCSLPVLKQFEESLGSLLSLAQSATGRTW